MTTKSVRKTVPRRRKKPESPKPGEYLCTYSGFPDEPRGGPTCCEPTTHHIECPKCYDIIARCVAHGAENYLQKVLENHLEVCEGPECDCWEGCNDREGKRPCHHYRLVEGAGPFYNTNEPGACRCGAMGPPWRHKKDCHHD